MQSLTANNLEPLPFQIEMVKRLREDEPKMWLEFSSIKTLDDLAKETRLLLLKQTVRLERASYEECYHAADQAMLALGLQQELIIYQGKGNEVNASLFYANDCIHLVMWGDLIERLNTDELRSLFGHELAHHLLWSCSNNDFFIADRILENNLKHPNLTVAQENSCIRFFLFTEIYADRGSLVSSGDLLTAISTLLKITTGLKNPDPQSYLKQAKEIFENSEKNESKGVTHPEEFIRVRALELWAEKGNDANLEIQNMIIGSLDLKTLDILSQQKIELLTQKFIAYILKESWMQTNANIGQAQLVWHDYASDKSRSVQLKDLDEIKSSDENLQKYWCYLLLDFAMADKDLEDTALLRTQIVAHEMGFKDLFEKIANDEIKGIKKSLESNWTNKDKRLSEIEKEIEKESKGSK